MYIYFYETNIGRIGIVEKEGNITNLCFASDEIPKDAQVLETPLLKEASNQLTAYLSGILKEFKLPLSPQGTDFQKGVWTQLCKIEHGKTASYKQIAIQHGNPKASRAVGLANNRNPIPIFIPCHRVIGANGKLVGYRGGLDLKEKLLRLEKENG